MFVSKKKYDAALDLISAYRLELKETYEIIGKLDQKTRKTTKKTAEKKTATKKETK